MTHGSTKIESKGACIYCGAADVKLTDEHIVPLSIGGQHVLLKASCNECNKITSKFELDVARGLWGDARNSYNAPSRRKAKRKKDIILTNPNAPHLKLKIPYSEYPAPMIFYEMDAAGILTGTPYSINTSCFWKLKSIVDEERLQKFEEKYPKQLTAKFKHCPDSFARMIAKIGYGQVLCSLDPNDFEPICLPFILGKQTNYSYIVGGQEGIPEPLEDLGYKLSTHTFSDSEQMAILAEIRLIADSHTPIYHVLVGVVNGKDNIERISKKVQATYAVTIPQNTKAQQQKPADNFHWMPRVWPLFDNKNPKQQY